MKRGLAVASLPVWLAPRASAPPAETVLPALHPGERHLLLLMIDGLPVAPFEEALAAHELPHLERLFAERPTLRTRAAFHRRSDGHREPRLVVQSAHPGGASDSIRLI